MQKTLKFKNTKTKRIYENYRNINRNMSKGEKYCESLTAFWENKTKINKSFIHLRRIVLVLSSAINHCLEEGLSFLIEEKYLVALLHFWKQGFQHFRAK